jgi:KDO2-lipid IV(A) lauroyltransferase
MTAATPAGPAGKPTLLRRLLPAIVPASKALIEIVGRLPRPAGQLIAAGASIPIRRLTWQRCRANIDAFFAPQGWDATQREALFRAHQRYMVRLRLEAARLLAGPIAEIEQVARLEGEDHLRAAIAGGRGALLVGIHEATWWHAPTLLARRGHDVRTVFNSFPLKSIDTYLVRRARRHGLRLSLVDQGAADEFRACARDNALFYLTFDLAVRPDSAAPFPFGPTLLPIERGPAILALRLGMVLLPVECDHLAGGRSLVRILPPFDPRRLGEDRVDELCRLWVARLESRVLRRPHCWWPWGFVDLMPAPDRAHQVR